MKKILATVAALMLCLTMAMPAFASNVTMIETNEAAVEKDDWDTSGAVIGTDGTDVKVNEALKDGSTDNFGDDLAADIATQVDLRVSATKVRVAVPLKLALVTDIAGGTITAPTGYYVENLSKGSVWVTGVSFSTPTSPYTLESAAPALTDFDKLYVPFKVTDAGLDTYCGNSGLTALTDTWQIAGTGAAYSASAALGTGTKSTITLTNGVASALSSAKDVANIFTITYTISAQKPATT